MVAMEITVFFDEKVHDNTRHVAIMLLYVDQPKRDGHRPIEGAFVDDTRLIKLWTTPTATRAQVRKFKQRLGEIMGRDIT
jgi:hypothetical protein